MRIGVPKEARPGERRVALVPETVGRLVHAGFEVLVEATAGSLAGFPDQDYLDAGGKSSDRPTALASDVVVMVGRPDATDLDRFRAGALLIGLLAPLQDPDLAAQLAARGIDALAMELIPRVTRAQGMDALSSQATVAGYLAALLAATHLPRFLPMLTTAAGTIPPAKVLVVGAGVAGLQAIATARRLGALTSGYDTRPAAREQILSLGARIIEIDLGTADTEGSGGYAKALSKDVLDRQREALAAAVAESDAVITTALVPGEPAPLLIDAPTLERMRPGSVVIDLAAESGGNCQLTEAGKTVLHHGVTIIGPVNLASQLPGHASQMYSRNIDALLGELTDGDELRLDPENDMVRAALVAQGGKVVERP